MDKNNDESSTPRRKPRFIPKAPARRKRAPTAPPPEDGDEDAEAAQLDQTLYRQFNENLGRRGPKVEKKSSARVASAPKGDTSSTSIRRVGPAKAKSSGNRSRSDDEQYPTLPSASNEDGKDVTMEDATDVASIEKVKKQYTPIWDYEHTYYPTTLPLRKPNSADPEVLNENDFGMDDEKEYDERTINPASDLGLLEEKEKKKMFFFQFPSILPVAKRSATAKGKEKAGSSTSVDSIGAPKKGCSLEELPAGSMGKMLVYKNGAVKMKLGDVLYDVSPGSDCVFAQDAVAINGAKNDCCVVGELKHRAVITPNVDSLLKVVINLD